MLKSICVYCGSADDLHPDYYQAARNLGRAMGQRGTQLIYGAGRTGLMGAVADGVLEVGGEVIGIMPRIFYTPTLVHAGLTRLEVMDDMHVRKARMVELAQAFIALPGGFGTLDELFETLTWAQIGLHAKPVGLLNTRGYFDPLLHMVEHIRREGFIYNEHRDLFTQATEPDLLLATLDNHRPPQNLERWLNRDE